MTLLSNNINDYYFVSQGKTVIPGLDDGEELLVTDVSAALDLSTSRSPSVALLFIFHIKRRGYKIEKV